MVCSGHGDLDECNGIEIDGEYAYFLTDTFPYVPRCLMGEATTGEEEGGGGGPGGGPGGAAGPESAMSPAAEGPISEGEAAPYILQHASTALLNRMLV